jgi:hypothetical protein
MRNICVALILCSAVGVGHAGERAASLVNSFQVMCMLEPLDFATSDAQAEGRGPKGEVKSCGIGAADVGGDDLKGELVKALALGQPVSEGRSPDGARRTSIWRHGSDGIDLMLTDGSPKAQPGIYLLLLKKP